LHIKTDIEGILNENSNLKQVISVLHPTPLFVDYLNRKQRILFWKTRGTGILHWFLGELNKEGFNKDTLKSDLYVNLRCMKIMKDQAFVWAAALQKIVILEKSGRRASTNR
jgi:isochorismate synthase